MDGDLVSPRDLLSSGAEFVIYNYFTRRSKFTDGDYVSVQIEMAGRKRYFNSGSRPLMDQLERTATGMPYRAKLVTKKSSSGRTYVTLA